jgi:hypothetical protein
MMPVTASITMLHRLTLRKVYVSETRSKMGSLERAQCWSAASESGRSISAASTMVHGPIGPSHESSAAISA